MYLHNRVFVPQTVYQKQVKYVESCQIRNMITTGVSPDLSRFIGFPHFLSWELNKYGLCTNRNHTRSISLSLNWTWLPMFYIPFTFYISTSSGALYCCPSKYCTGCINISWLQGLVTPHNAEKIANKNSPVAQKKVRNAWNVQIWFVNLIMMYILSCN